MKVCVVDPASIKNDQTSQFQQHRQQTPIAAAKYLIISYIKCMQHNRWICAAAHFTDESFPQKSSDCSPHKPHNRIKNHPVRSISLELNCFHAMLTIMIMVVCVSVCSPASSKHSHAEQIPDLPCNNADLPTSPPNFSQHTAKPLLTSSRDQTDNSTCRLCLWLRLIAFHRKIPRFLRRRRMVKLVFTQVVLCLC